LYKDYIMKIVLLLPYFQVKIFLKIALKYAIFLNFAGISEGR
jgi:hypothetical protein